jgi:hypothetical protein
LALFCLITWLTNTLALPLVYLGVVVLAALGGLIYAAGALMRDAGEPLHNWGVLLLCLAALQTVWGFWCALMYGWT